MKERFREQKLFDIEKELDVENKVNYSEKMLSDVPRLKLMN